MRLLAMMLLAAALLVGCDERRVYELNQDFSDHIWRVRDTARFDFVIADPGKKYNVYYNVRNSLDYPFARLFVQYSLYDSTGLEIQKKLMSAFLFDFKSGKPEGSSGLGDVYDHQFPLLNEYAFTAPGKYSIKLQQFMRLDSLPGILSIGVRVESEEEKK